MRAQDSQAEYQRRIHKVLAYIDQHLDEDLSLEVLADVAHFSRFHFHRVFVALSGETLGDYLRRRRVEVAATRLATQPGLSVLNAALMVGFGSGEAFSRAFKARFGMSPTVWRQQSNSDQALSKMDQASFAVGTDHLGSQSSQRKQLMNVTLIDRPPVRVAYLRYTGPYGPGINFFWQEKAYPWLVASGLLGRARYGVSLDDPDVTAPEKCRYDASVEVDASFKPSGEAVCTELPGGRYAVLRFKGPVAEIGAAWASLFTHWLPASGQQLDSRPMFEYYPVEGDIACAPGEIVCDICIPVSAL
jgi:AraC family transcriptional regulator